MRTAAMVLVFGLGSAVALAQDNAFPTEIDGFRFDQPSRAMQRACTAQNGTWEPGGCTLGTGTPDVRFVSFPDLCRRNTVCRVSQGYYESLPADDRAGWMSKFAAMRTELQTRFGSQAVPRAGRRECAEQVLQGNGSCVFDNQGAGVQFAFTAGAGEVLLSLSYNSMRHSPSITRTWASAAAVEQDRNTHEAPTPH
ncbi:MAG: hypothetical protein IPK60_15795 [Sandaracinaceae bacterium]|nr:hypothetical protein [Sandaracinaceae bacterium]